MEEKQTIQIIQPSTNDHYSDVQLLIRAFVNWHRQRHIDLSLTNDYFNPDALESELANLPTKYATGRNRLLLALYQGEAAGCVAFREMDKETCEMKRMFVHQKFSGKGIGRALATAIVRLAKEVHFSTMKLETSVRQTEAQRLYEGLGFKMTAPYYSVPKRLEEWLVFMELQLK